LTSMETLQPTLSAAGTPSLDPYLSNSSAQFTAKAF
jgi:hypothetical protein